MTHQIREVSIIEPQVEALIRLHIRGMLEVSSPETAYTLDPKELDAAHITMFGAIDPITDTLMAVTALSEMSKAEAEIKSMRTHPDHVGKGLGTALLKRVIEICRDRNYTALLLETGTHESFYPAVRLYERHGFKPTGIFGEYVPDPANQFFKLDL